MYRSVCIQGMCIKETNWFILGFQNAACGFCNSILQPLLLFWKPSQSSLLVARLRFRAIDSGLFLPLSLPLFFLNPSQNVYALKVKRSGSCRQQGSVFNCRLGVVQQHQLPSSTLTRPLCSLLLLQCAEVCVRGCGRVALPSFGNYSGPF